jgi:hypothetical protein
MDINPRLYVEIHPFEGPRQPYPHPVRDGKFDPAYVYKVLGMYNPSETSECYFVLANPERQIWFIPQRHLLAHRLIDSEELFLPREPLPSKHHLSHSPVQSRLPEVLEPVAESP